MHQIDVAGIDFLPIEQHAADMASAVDEVIHAIEQTQERRFSASGRSNECCNGTLGDFNGNVKQSLLGAIPERQLPHTELGAQASQVRSCTTIHTPFRD